MKTIKIDSNHITASDNQLTIPISGLVKQCKIINATISSNLTFTNSSVYSFAVNFSALDSKDVLVESWENVDFLKDVSSGEFAINISDELQTALDHNCSKIVLSFDCTDSIEFSESDLQIDYTSLSEYKENASSHNLDLGTCGKASVDLATGRLSMTAPITSNDNNVLPLSISANYQSTENASMPTDIGMPKNWHLNVNQFLIKEENNDGDLQFTYIDEEGKSQTITEQYYYLNEGEPKNVSRTELEVDLDGNYIYQGNPVKTKLVAPSGLKLVSSIADITGSDLVDYEPEELKQIKDQLNQLNKNKSAYEKNETLLKKQIFISALTKYQNTNDLFTQYLQLNNPEVTNDEGVYNTIIESIMSDLLSTTIVYSDNITDDIKFKEIAKTLTKEDIKDIIDNFSFDTYKEQISNKYTNVTTISEDFKKSPVPADVVLLNNEVSLENLTYQHTNCIEQIKEIKNLIDKYKHQQKLYEAQVPVHYLYNDSNVIYGFGKTLDADDNETNVYRLNLITDAYENAITITYESMTSNKITSITDSSDKTISFEYDETTGYLNNIVDTRDRKTSFIYEDTLLKEIKNNGKSTFFTYIAKESENTSSTDETTIEPEFNLEGVLSPAGTGVKFTYTNNQVTEIQALSIVDSIEHENYKPNPNYNEKLNNFLDCLVSDRKVNFVYNNYKSTTVTNSKNKSITYIFDKYGKVRSTYETGYVDTTTGVAPEDFYTKVNEFSYENDKVTFKATDLPNSINYLEDIRCSFTAVQQKEALSLGSLTCGLDCIPYSYPVYADYYQMPHDDKTQYKVTIDSDNNSTILTKLNEDSNNLSNDTNKLPDESNLQELNIGCNHRTLMLSTWARADSAFIITEDNEETKTYPEYITDRKFELRAIIYYKNETNPVTQSAQFDWRNTGWQYIALPLSLKLKEIVKIEFILDYSNNTNTIDFTDLELKLGDFEKTKYNTDGLPESKENGHSKWITSYQYDKNSNIIKQTLTNKFDDKKTFDAYFEYNKQGKLIKTTNFNNIIEETVYNDKGSVVKTLTYHKDEPANIICEETILDDKGKQPYAVNEFGEKLYDYEYIDGTGITSSTIDTKGVKTSYGYDNHDTLLQTTTSIKGEENTNIYGYTLDTLTALTHNNFDVKYAYDNKGRKTKISIADKTYLEKVYGENEEITFYKLSENENLYDVYKHTYDYNGNLLDVYYEHNITVEDKSQISFEDNTLILQNVYNIYGNLVYTKDFTNGEVSHTILFDDFGQVENQTTTLTDATVVVKNKYEADHSTIKSCTITISSENNKYGTQPMSYEYTYSKEPEAKLQSIQSALGNENIYYDKLGRVHKIDLAPLAKEFAYLKKGNYTSNLVSKINFATNNVINDNLTYKYDEKGNITEVRQYNKLIARYKYDALSRIIREDNKDFNTTTTFEYDAGGNILCKKVYAFTIVDNLDFEDELEYIPYTYPISGWRDQLLSYNGESFEYDNLGNPTKYRDKVLQWSHGRQLDAFADVATYTYNANGIRTSKTYYTDKSCQCETNNCTCQNSDCFTTKFFLNGNKIIKQHDCCNDLTFYYGADGLTGFHIKSTNAVYNKENLDHDFFYKKNLQGDIIGIIDSKGNEIVKYVYDAWGNHKALNAKTNEPLDISRFESYTNTGNIVQFIAIKNPFRYRSYYYDFETGLYYLNSRYYDPELARFINADDINAIDVTKITTNGLNLYCYCLNNPVNDKDDNGYIVSWLLAIIIGAVIGGLVSAAFEVASQVNTHGWSISSWNWGQIGLSFLGGAVAGAISSLPIPGFASLGIWGKLLHFSLTAIAGGTGAVVGGLINGSVSNINSAITTFVIGASFNLLSEVITISLNKLTQKIANKTLQNPLFSDMTLEDLIGSGLKEYPKSLSSLMSKLSKAIQFANGGLSRSIFYMLGISSVMEFLSGLIQ